MKVMYMVKKVVICLSFIVFSLQLFALEIDQLTNREIYMSDIKDFTETLNNYTNSLIISAVESYNSQYGTIRLPMSYIHKLMAYEIYLATAGNWTNQYGEIIPDELNIVYALRKSGLGHVQQWIEGNENASYRYRLKNNFYSDIYPVALNKNYILKVAGEFIGPDKIDHFFDQGYSYWVISDCGNDDQKAKKFGVATEFSWFGFLTGGVFSFADLRANWAGYQFYINLFNGENSHLIVKEDGNISIRRAFDWSEHIDWQFDELKNPSMYTEAVMEQITSHIDNNYESYRKTFDYLKEQNFSSYFDKREDYYFTDDLQFDSDTYFDVRKLISDL